MFTYHKASDVESALQLKATESACVPTLLWDSSRKKTQSARSRCEWKRKRRLLLFKLHMFYMFPSGPEKLLSQGSETTFKREFEKLFE